MAKVSKANGEGGTTDGMYVHKFSGGGIDQFEFPSGNPHNHIGDTFVVSTRVELRAVISDRTNDGPREVLALRVINSAPPKFVAKAGKDDADPNQYSIEDYEDDTTPQPGDYDPDTEPEDAPEEIPEAGPDEVDPAKFSPFTVVGE